MLGEKKGLAAGQVFVYIVAALTFALIMIFGYKIISGFIFRGEEVQFLQFKNNLETAVKDIYFEFGSVREKTFHLPGKYKQICFIDVNHKFNPALCQYDPAACQFWKTSEDYDSAAENVFLKPAASQQIKVSRIQVIPAKKEDEGFLCLPISRGTFKIRLEGRGDSTAVSLSEE